MDDQNINCNYYSCMYGCTKKKFCKYLNYIFSEDDEKNYPKKTIIETEKKWYPLNKPIKPTNLTKPKKPIKSVKLIKPKKEQEKIFPEVDLTNLVKTYNDAVDLYNDCIDIINDHFNSVTSVDKEFIESMELYKDLKINLEKKINKLVLDSNIVYPIKEVMKLIDVMGENIKKIIYFINEVHKSVENIKYDNIESIDKQINEILSKNISTNVMKGGGKLDDLKDKILDVQRKLQNLKKQDPSTYDIEKFIKLSSDKLDNKANNNSDNGLDNTKIYKPVRIDFEGVKIPEVLFDKIEKEFSTDINAKLNIVQQKNNNENNNSNTKKEGKRIYSNNLSFDENIKNLNDKNKILEELKKNYDTKTIKENIEKIKVLYVIGYDDTEFNFQNLPKIFELYNNLNNNKNELKKLEDELIELKKQQKEIDELISQHKTQIDQLILQYGACKEKLNKIITLSKELNFVKKNANVLYGNDIISIGQQVTNKIEELENIKNKEAKLKKIIDSLKKYYTTQYNAMTKNEQSKFVSVETFINSRTELERLNKLKSLLDNNIKINLLKLPNDINKNDIEFIKSYNPVINHIDEDLLTKLQTNISDESVQTFLSSINTYDTKTNTQTNLITNGITPAVDAMLETKKTDITNNITTLETKKTKINTKIKCVTDGQNKTNNFFNKFFDRHQIQNAYMSIIGLSQQSAGAGTSFDDLQDDDLQDYDQINTKIDTNYNQTIELYENIVKISEIIHFLKAPNQDYVNAQNELFNLKKNMSEYLKKIKDILYNLIERATLEKKIITNDEIKNLIEKIANTNEQNYIIKNRLKNFAEILKNCPSVNDVNNVLIIDQSKKSFLDILLCLDIVNLQY